MASRIGYPFGYEWVCPSPTPSKVFTAVQQDRCRTSVLVPRLAIDFNGHYASNSQYVEKLSSHSTSQLNERAPMKNKWVWGLIGLIALCATGASQAQTSSAATEKAIEALELQWLKSDQTNNVELTKPLLADGYVSTGVDGTMSDVAATLADQKARTYTSAEYEDLKVTAFGNTAIARGIYKGKGTLNGKPFDERMRWTDAWVKMSNGKWQCVASHYGRAAP